MKRTAVTAFVLAAFLTFGKSIQVKVLTIPELPRTEASKQWTLEVNNPDNDYPNLAQAKRGVYHTYCLNMKNIGKDVYDVKVQLFRNESNSNTKYGFYQLWSRQSFLRKTDILYMFPILVCLKRQPT
ncbi:hypothetical protein ACEWPB_10770 [Priestia megaterium]|uniref:hypothetical protein n=1 Tax=Priestia megaterium TaxID=1404 RepID=UPI0035CAA0CB